VNLRMTVFGVRARLVLPLAAPTIRSGSSGNGRRSVGRVRPPVLGHKVMAAAMA
jgi:hypothetical protein